MKKKQILIFEITIALIAFIVGYIFVAGIPSVNKATAYSLPKPTPHIVYLAPSGIERGLVNELTMQKNGATLSQSWQSVRLKAIKQPLNALLIDQLLFNQMSQADEKWLQEQLEQGVVIVGLGVEDEQLARSLGLKSLKASGEKFFPIGARGYRLVQGLILGHPDDVSIIKQDDWTVYKPKEGIKYPLVSFFHKSRGELNSAQDMELLFIRIRFGIGNVNRTHAEYQQMVEDFEEKQIK